MWEESAEQPRPLRTGWTTGACATACAVASAHWLLSKHSTRTVSISLPKGKVVEFQVVSEKTGAHSVRSATVKDAGDDPDVTHGATVFTEVVLRAAPGVVFKAAKGVGTVTRDGLALAVGEPAINPVPRRMIEGNLAVLAAQWAYRGGFEVAVGIENGEVIAQKTMNARLGILGGLSILGTTGIVRPFSCAAWIASIHQGIDVARANGLSHIAASTGNSSEQAIQARYRLDDMALIEMGDFAGAVLKYVKRHPPEQLSLCGGFGKITKLANGHMDLNSRVSAIDFDQIAQMAARAGADQPLQSAIQQANTSIEALQLCQRDGIALGDAMCVQALSVVRGIVPERIQVAVFAVNRQGEFVGSADDHRVGFH